MTAGTIILTLKVAVVAVTLLLISSLVALARGRYRLHGRINFVVFVLTEVALLGLEVVSRLIDPEMFREYFTSTNSWRELRVHLFFAIPCAILLPILLFTGLRGRIRIHYPLALVFAVLWLGTLITGVFFLPHRG